MIVKLTTFLTYWRDLNAQLKLLGKAPASLGMAQAAYRYMAPEDAARVIPGSGRL